VKHPPAWVTFFPARLACFACMLLRDHLIHRFEIVHIKASRHIAFAAALVSKPFRSKIIFSPGNIERSHRRRFRPEARSRSASNECTKLAARLADCLNTMTQIQAAGYAPYVSPTTTVAIIPNGIDSGLFTKNTLALDEPYTFLHVGIQYRTKNQQMLLDCFARISRHVRCKLYVVGADLLHGRLEAHAAALGIASDVTFTGHVPYHELPAYYQKAHVFLLTSFFESQALVINEAMASGVVVCGTKVGLIADLSPDLCIGIESFDPDVLADAVLQLIHDRARYADMRDRAYAWATHHDLSWTVEQYLALYDRLLQG
jgi:glycosyltransferase involved in cell wall biosynthesis